jgi:Tol biopolymer transport system component
VHDELWYDLSLSPNGEQAVAERNGRLEVIDLVHGTIKSLGGFREATWSPDGQRIAAIEDSKRQRLFLIDPTTSSRRRILSYCPIRPTWSPDSRYILLQKWYLFRCGFSLDVEGPATLQTLDVKTGKKSTIRSSKCEVQGVTGWVSRELLP